MVASGKLTGVRVVYPGSFNPPTIAHAAIVEAVLELPDVVSLTLALSHVALNKEAVSDDFDDRLVAVQAWAARRPRCGVVATDRQLIVDIAEGYDAVVMGADKWGQVHELQYYASPAHRDESLLALPLVLFAPRSDGGPAARTDSAPASSARLQVLRIDHALGEVSSSAVRSGRTEWAAE